MKNIYRRTFNPSRQIGKYKSSPSQRTKVPLFGGGTETRMTSALLILMMIILYTMQSLFCKVYSDNYPGDKNSASVVFSIVSGAIVAVVYL